MSKLNEQNPLSRRVDSYSLTCRHKRIQYWFIVLCVFVLSLVRFQNGKKNDWHQFWHRTCLFKEKKKPTETLKFFPRWNSFDCKKKLFYELLQIPNLLKFSWFGHKQKQFLYTRTTCISLYTIDVIPNTHVMLVPYIVQLAYHHIENCV